MPATEAPNQGIGGAAETSREILVPGSSRSHARCREIGRSSRERGLPDARLQGFPGRRRAHGGEVLGGLCALLCIAVALVVPHLGLGGLIACALLSLHGALGGAGFDRFLPRIPCWNVILRSPSAPVRRLVFLPLDRARVRRGLRFLSAATVAFAAGAFAGPGWLVAVAAVSLGLLVITSWNAGVPRPTHADLDAMVEAMVQGALHAPEGEVHVISDCGAADGEGARALLDWAGMDKHTVTVQWVGDALADAGRAQLAREGWKVIGSAAPDPVPAAHESVRTPA